MRQGITRFLMLTAVALAIGVPALPSFAAKVPAEWNPGALAVDIKLGTPEQQADALAKMKQWLDMDPRDGALQLRRLWAKPLMESGRNQEVAEWCLAGILGSLDDVQQLEDLSQIRVQALMALGKYPEALQAGKSYFNVARSKATGQALSLMAKCIEKAYPKDPGIYELFRKEQIAGAAADGSAQTSSVMNSITIDGEPYAKLARQYSELEQDDNQSLLAHGHLLLLAGRGEEALKIFKELEGPNGRLATEGIARAIKTRDGVIGNANAYLLSGAEGRKP